MPATWNHPDADDPSATAYTDATTYGGELAPIVAMFMAAFRERANVLQQYKAYGVFIYAPPFGGYRKELLKETPWPKIYSGFPPGNYPFAPPGATNAINPTVGQLDALLIGQLNGNAVSANYNLHYAPNFIYAWPEGPADTVDGANKFNRKTRDDRYATNPVTDPNKGGPFARASSAPGVVETIGTDYFSLQSVLWIMAAFFLKTGTADAQLKTFPWPPPGGFTRKYPREIYTLAQTQGASEGQTARFVILGVADEVYFPDQWTVTTPPLTVGLITISPFYTTAPPLISNSGFSTISGATIDNIASEWAVNSLLHHPTPHTQINEHLGIQFTGPGVARQIVLKLQNLNIGSGDSAVLRYDQATAITAITQVKIVIHHSTDAVSAQNGGVTTSIAVNLPGAIAQEVISLDAGEKSSGFVVATFVVGASSWGVSVLNNLRVTITSTPADSSDNISQQIHSFYATIGCSIAAAADPLENLAVPLAGTPIDEFDFAGKLMRFTSGAWITWDEYLETHPLATAPTQPDTVSAVGLPGGGDFFGPWILNEMRGALNLMTQTFGVRGSIDTFTGGVQYYNANDLPEYLFGLESDHRRVSFLIGTASNGSGANRFEVVDGPAAADSGGAGGAGIAREIDFYYCRPSLGESAGARKHTAGPFKSWAECKTQYLFDGSLDTLNYAIARWNLPPDPDTGVMPGFQQTADSP